MQTLLAEVLKIETSLTEILKEIKSLNQKMENLLNVFIKYDAEYNQEILKDQGRSDLLS